MEISRKVDAKGRVMLPTYIHLNLKEFGIYLKKDEKKVILISEQDMKDLEGACKYMFEKNEQNPSSSVLAEFKRSFVSKLSYSKIDSHNRIKLPQNAHLGGSNVEVIIRNSYIKESHNNPQG